MITRQLEHFSLAQICESGQCFRMRVREDGAYQILSGNRFLLAEQRGDECTFYCDEEDFEAFWKQYFSLDENYSYYIAQIHEKDIYLKRAAEFGAGIRILRQDLWEMIVSFLISQQNNIIRIRRCIENICRAYGERRISETGEVYYAFPGPEAFAELPEDALMECNLGYRSKYVVRTASAVAKGQVRLANLQQMTYEEAKAELLKLYGVGEKVADCICLFALHHLQAFPVDTHIRQALSNHYRKGFPKKRYRGFEGVLQQYIFFYELMGGGVDEIWDSGAG